MGNAKVTTEVAFMICLWALVAGAFTVGFLVGRQSRKIDAQITYIKDYNKALKATETDLSRAHVAEVIHLLDPARQAKRTKSQAVRSFEVNPTLN